MKSNILKEKSYAFSLRIVNSYKYISEQHREQVLSRQLLRSGTAVDALIREAEFGQSRADFINKLSIALKEANETDYWLSLRKDSGYLNDKMHQSIDPEIKELIRLLVASIKTKKEHL